MKLRKIFSSFWPIIIIIGIWITLFWPFFKKGLLPIPADIITGVYYPWLDYKWGFSTGVPVKNPLISDVPSLLYPWRSLVIDELKSLHWPLWNPYYFAGMPLLANFQSAVFSYVNLFFLFMPKALGWSLGVMSSPLLTLLAVYFFLRNKKLSKISSLLGAVVFSLSGFEIAWMEYNVHGHTALFLPLLLLAIDKIFSGKKHWLGVLSLLVALQIFTGYIPIVIYSYLLCLFYILYSYFLPERNKVIVWRKYFLPVFFWILGILLAAVQLFPGIELLRNSIRKVDLLVGSSDASYLPLKHLATLLAPDYFGNPATYNYFGKGFYDNFYFFVGAPIVILLIYSLFLFKKQREIKFWWFGVLFSFLLAFNNPLGKILMSIFQLSGGVAARSLFIADFAFAVISAFSLEDLLQRKDFKKITFCIVQVFLLFLSLFFFSLAFSQAKQREVALRNLVIPFLFYVSSSLSLLVASLKKHFWSKIKFSERWSGKIFSGSFLFFVFLVTFQLTYSARKYLPFSKKELIFPSTPTIDFLMEKAKENKEPFRVELGDVVPQNFLMAYGIETTSGYDALLPKKTGEFIVGLNSQNYSLGISRVQLINNYNSPLFPLTNTKYIFAKKSVRDGVYGPEGTSPGEFKDINRFKLAFEDKTVQVFEDLHYLPRAFWVHNYEIATSSNEFMKKLRSGVDFREKVFLEKEPNFQVESKGKSKINEIVWNKDSPNEIVLMVKSDQPGIIFLSNNFFPGWYAYIDGKETEIYRANYTFQAIAVAQGSYEIKLVYNPLSFRLGMFLTLISLCILLLSAFTSIAFNYPLNFKK